MAAPRLLLHIGYHKTATTWMQDLLFTPEHGFQKVMGHDDVFALITGPHGLTFDPGPAQRLVAERMTGIPADRVPVVSSEILSGHPFFGGRESDVFAHRLKAIFPEARVLVSIRAQLRILPSVYQQYILRGGTMTPAQFFSEERPLGFDRFSAIHFEYDRLVGLYQDLYGRENVYILQQEALQKDMEAASTALARFAGASAYAGLTPAARRVRSPSYPEHAVWALRRINHVQTSVLNPNPVISLGTTPQGMYRLAGYVLRHGPLAALLKGRRPISDVVRRRFSGRFDDSNARLAGLAANPIDLSHY